MGVDLRSAARAADSHAIHQGGGLDRQRLRRCHSPLGVAGLVFEAITRSPLRSTFKVVLLALAGVTVALVWAQGAVGIF